jgi:hypothetical protein
VGGRGPGPVQRRIQGSHSSLACAAPAFLNPPSSRTGTKTHALSHIDDVAPDIAEAPLVSRGTVFQRRCGDTTTATRLGDLAAAVAAATVAGGPEGR